MKSSVTEWSAKAYDFSFSLHYFLSQPEPHHETNGIVICLHGYQDHALSMLRRLGWLDNPTLPFRILAINAPFPVPVWDKDGFKDAYSWYFRDSQRQLLLYSPDSMAEILSRFIDDLNLQALPKVILGFSQGGYLAPYLARKIQNLSAIIGLGCGYPLQAYKDLSCPQNIFALHGTKDERIAIEKAKAEWSKLLELGFKGEFIEFADLGHRVDQKFAPRVCEFSLASLKALKER